MSCRIMDMNASWQNHWDGKFYKGLMFTCRYMDVYAD